MKLSEMAKTYNISEVAFDLFLKTNPPIRYKTGLLGTVVEDEDVSKAVELFQEYKAQATELYYRTTEEEKAAYNRKKQLKEDFPRIKEEMILSTCPSVDGFVAEEQLGLVFGECVLKASFSDAMSATMENLGASFSFAAKEMSGTMDLIEKAREYTMDKMILEAASRGANAIVGIDCESSAGVGSLLHITMFGTAVKLRKL